MEGQISPAQAAAAGGPPLQLKLPPPVVSSAKERAAQVRHARGGMEVPRPRRGVTMDEQLVASSNLRDLLKLRDDDGECDGECRRRTGRRTSRGLHPLRPHLLPCLRLRAPRRPRPRAAGPVPPAPSSVLIAASPEAQAAVRSPLTPSYGA
ncbi:uncharacterized protein C2845_PM13G10000 [Panicum miliaceum]|uniref:Uncharacterized protein n=1 Tax=Panicum miliaceum TaxID=4540 RepID=A0A3L6RKV2_PANMI|nr:uncharacterized protein C2845_PM13G10000 [Panicum miliaceum]